ncbi:hypothetical protein G6F65_018806 [Rhizopus arrhizus]|nr:hypothetical protein G6F65_018806 [Rhizopus arrhizus]
MKRVTTELGGHAPVSVAEDADGELAVKASGGAKFRNAGQVCISPTRFLVHKSIKAAFEKAFVAHAEKLKLGDGLTEGTTLGPLANDRRLPAMDKSAKNASEKGARIATGGARVGGAGNFFAPTILTDVPLDADIFNEEPFGPIAAIPKALKQAGLTQDQLDWIELNEAFAAQSLAVIRDCGLDPSKVNPLGGAIALGHPLGATGAIRTATLLHGLRRRQQKYGMVTMCIGTGMGAAGIFEAL